MKAKTSPQRRRDRSERKLGVYRLGTQHVSVVTFGNDDRGTIQLWPPPGIARINLGLDQDWDELVECVLHEALEFTMIQMLLRYIPAPSFSGSNGDFTFIMNHQQFQEMCARSARFLAEVMPDLAKRFNHGKKKQKPG
jgi:hypothetical protein